MGLNMLTYIQLKPTFNYKTYLDSVLTCYRWYLTLLGIPVHPVRIQTGRCVRNLKHHGER